jgi:hypothetical protein
VGGVFDSIIAIRMRRRTRGGRGREWRGERRGEEVVVVGIEKGEGRREKRGEEIIHTLLTLNRLRLKLRYRKRGAQSSERSRVFLQVNCSTS